MAKLFVVSFALLVAFTSVAYAHDGDDDDAEAQSTTTNSSTAATEECATNVSTAFIAVVDNSTYFDTCAAGTTFNVTSLFDVLNFTDADFLTFCNSSQCLEPVHSLMDSEDCLIMYNGTLRDLADEVSDLHDKCHEVLDAAGLDMNMDGTNSTTPSTTPGTTSSASSVALTLGSVISAAILAAILA